MRIFGLVGYPLSHSFSKRYFTEKFQKEGITDASYENFELASIADFPSIVQAHPSLKGVNVTIPYKQAILPFLTRLDSSAEFVGAVNVVKRLDNGELVGYNSDYYGFMESLKRFLPSGYVPQNTLILGTGGAAKAVEAALTTLGFPFENVSRQGRQKCLSYDQLNADTLHTSHLIINTTPLGMYPKTEEAPALDYSQIGNQHYLFDLVYNPLSTLFMQKGESRGASVKNGLEMLQLQAEKAWEIWNS